MLVIQYYIDTYTYKGALLAKTKHIIIIIIATIVVDSRHHDERLRDILGYLNYGLIRKSQYIFERDT